MSVVRFHFKAPRQSKISYFVFFVCSLVARCRENVDDFALSTNITASSKGSCFLFTTYVEEEYVDFIENLDREKYGIVDITIQPETFKQGKCFLITYIQKSNETQ